MVMNNDMKSECQRIGINLLLCRKRLGFQQEEIALHSGVSRSQISRIERGASNFKLKSLIMIAEAMNIDYREFFK